MRKGVAYAVCLLGLYILGSFFPTGVTWGFHFLAFFPLGWTILYVVLIGTAIVLIPRVDVDRFLTPLANALDTHPLKFLAVTLAVVICWAVGFHVRVPLLGDSFYLIKNFVDAYRGTDSLYPRDEPLATYYFFIMLNKLGFSSYQHFLNSFLVAEVILLIGYCINIFFVVRMLFPEKRSRLLALLFLLSFPYMQVFFGYVETYAVVLYSLSLYVLCAALSFHKKAPFVVVPIAFLIMVTTHYLTALLLPSLCVVSYYEVRRKRTSGVVLGLAAAGSMFLGILAAVQFDVERFSSWVPHSHILSLASGTSAIEDYSEAYTMFSPYHAADLVNALLLWCPAALFLIAATFGKLRSLLRVSPLMQFLVSSIVPLGAFLLVVKFDLGAARDWDVFSPYVILVALMAAVLYFSHTEPARERLFLLILAVTFTNTLLFTFLNSSEEASVRRYRSFFDRRILSHNGFYGGTLQLSQYYHQVADVNHPVEIWKDYVQQFPGDSRGFINVVNSLSKQTNISLAQLLPLLELWKHNGSDTNSQNVLTKFMLDVGNDYFGREDFQRAADWFQALITIAPAYSKAYNNLGSAYAQEKLYDRAAAMLEKALAIDSLYGDAYYNLGQVYNDLGDKRKGRVNIEKGATLGNAAARQWLDQGK